MQLKNNKTSLFILGLTSIACSRVMFVLFDDPEGPNLVVVTGMALIVYVLSLGAYLLNPFKLANPSKTPDDNHPLMGFKELGLVIVFQLIIATGFYFLL